MRDAETQRKTKKTKIALSRRKAVKEKPFVSFSLRLCEKKAFPPLAVLCGCVRAGLGFFMSWRKNGFLNAAPNPCNLLHFPIRPPVAR